MACSLAAKYLPASITARNFEIQGKVAQYEVRKVEIPVLRSAHCSQRFSWKLKHPQTHGYRKRGRLSRIYAQDNSGLDVSKIVDAAVKTGKQTLASATDIVPESVPRPLATAGVSVVAILVATTIIKTIFSTIFSFLILGGLGYAAFVYFAGGKGDGGGSGGSSGSSSDPLDEARKIMDKYK